MNMPILSYLKEISPRNAFVAGEKAHSRYFSEDYNSAAQPKELMIIPGAFHVDLYDKVDVIPFYKPDAFFMQDLK